MNPELVYIAWVMASVGLFALGGTTWKPWRRYGLPVFGYFVLTNLGVDSMHSALAMGTLCGVLHLPYGDKTVWAVRFPVFASYSVAPVFIVKGRWLEFAVWIGITSVLLSLAFLASRNAKLQWVMKWKVWEMLAGFLIAASFIPHLP
jgi:hypothetical protein